MRFLEHIKWAGYFVGATLLLEFLNEIYHYWFSGEESELYMLLRAVLNLVGVFAGSRAFDLAFRQSKPMKSLTYCSIVLFSLTRIFFAEPLDRVDMVAKAYLIYLVPSLCHSSLQHQTGKRVNCYDYEMEEWRDALLLDPDDDLSKDKNKWPMNLRFEAAGANIKAIEALGEWQKYAMIWSGACRYSNTTRIVGHIYLIQGRC